MRKPVGPTSEEQYVEYIKIKYNNTPVLERSQKQPNKCEHTLVFLQHVIIRLMAHSQVRSQGGARTANKKTWKHKLLENRKAAKKKAPAAVRHVP